MINDKTDNYARLPTHMHLVAASLSVSNNTSTLQYTRPALGSTGLTIGLVIFYTLVAFTAITSNIFIVLAICRKLVPRNTVNIFLSSLAISDFFMVILSIFDCVAYLQSSWLTGLWTCKVQSFFIEVTFSASTLTLVAVSVERYLLICYPHMKKRTIKAIYSYVILVWVLSLCICSPLLDGYIVYSDIDTSLMTEELVCANKGWNNKYLLIYYYTFSAVTYILPLIIMAFAHWRISASVRNGPRLNRPQGNPSANICYTIKEESSNGSSNVSNESVVENTPESKSRKASGVQRALLGSFTTIKRKAAHLAERDLSRREKRLKAIRVLFIVTVVFFILWTPFIFMRIIALSGIKINGYVYKFSEVLIFSSTAVNGFIYAFMSPPFKKAFRAIICCKSRREFYSRDSGPSFSNSEDRAPTRGSRSVSTASCAVDSRSSTLSNGKKNGNQTAVV